MAAIISAALTAPIQNSQERHWLVGFPWPRYDTTFVLSNRRRHTRLTFDWSSDVCSSDLDAGTPVVLDILDASGKTVRSFSSADSIEPIENDLNVPTYWVRPQQRVAVSRGTHRFVWDLHYAPPKVLG